MAALFPPRHPYHWLTIGDPEHLRAATLDEVRQFFATYYHPANASLAIAGDIEARKAFDLASDYFGEIPTAPRPTQPDTVLEPVPREEQRLLLQDRVELPRLYLSWRTPSLFADGDAELDLLAQVLAGGKSSRLYRELVHDRRLATDVSAGQGSRELASTFGIAATAAPGHGLSELSTVITEVLARVCADGPTDDEVERARARVEADFVYRLQTMGGFGGRSDQLNAYNVMVGDAGYFSTDLARFVDATQAAIGAAARTYLASGGGVALSVIPHGLDASVALDGSSPVEPT